MKEWPYVGDVLWDSEAQSHLATRARYSRGVPIVGCICLPVVGGPCLLMWHALASCEAWAKLRDGCNSHQVCPLEAGLEGEFQNGTHQHWHWQGSLKVQKLCLPVSQSLGSIPTDSSLSGSCFKVSVYPSPTVYALFNLMFLCWFSG